MHYSRRTLTLLYTYSTFITTVLALAALFHGLSQPKSIVSACALFPASLYFFWRTLRQRASNQLYYANHPLPSTSKHYSISFTIALYIIALGLTIAKTYTTLALASAHPL